MYSFHDQNITYKPNLKICLKYFSNNANKKTISFFEKRKRETLYDHLGHAHWVKNINRDLHYRKTGFS